MDNERITDCKTITGPDVYYGWPTITARADGELLIVGSGNRKEHVCPFGQVCLLRSPDGGETWTEPEVLVNGPLDDRDAGVLETAKGTLIVNWFSSVAWLNYLYRQETGEINWLAPETCAEWRPVREEIARSGNIREELGDWTIRSEDGGKTWSSRVPSVVNSPHGPIQASDGRLLYAGKRTQLPNNWRRGSSHEPGESGLAESLDDGKSWRWVSTIPQMPGHDVADYHELHLAECANGRLIAQIRNHGSPFEGETLQTESTDGGITWTVPHTIRVWGTPSHVLRLQDSRLLMTYGHRRAPFGNQARISDDSGQTWTEPIILSDDGKGTDLGYPSTAQLPDGNLVSVWYENFQDGNPAALRLARWSLPA